MRLANGNVVTMTHKIVALQITVYTAQGPVVLDSELFAIVP